MSLDDHEEVMVYKFLHSADFHIDSPLRGLSRYEGAPVEQIREASRNALKNLVQLAIDEGVSFAIFSGDTFDGSWKDYQSGLFFINQLVRLKQEGVKVFAVLGNHDSLSTVSRNLRLPDNTHLFSPKACETKISQDLGVAIHGRSFPAKAVDENWIDSYPKPVKDLFNIGVLHTSLSGYEGHDLYAPCTRDSLINKGYDYWALGHVHTREVVHTNPHIIFPGNIQGRHIRETGPKGCYIVTVEDNEVTAVEFKELDVLRWYNLSIDASGKNEDELLRLFSDHMLALAEDAGGRISAVRVTFTGACSAHAVFMRDPEKWRYELRASAIDIGQGDIWLEKIIFSTSSPSKQVPEGLLRDIIDNIKGADNNELLTPDNGSSALKKLFEKLPPEIIHGEEPLSLDDKDWLKKSLDEGMEHLVAKMLSSGEQ